MYLEARLRGDLTKTCTITKPNGTTRSINHLTLDKSDPGITLNEALNVLLPQVLPAVVSVPAQTMEDCNRLRSVRNDAIHAPHKFNGAEVTDARLDSIKTIIDIIANA